MKFLVENWYLIVAAAAAVAVGGYCVYVFVKKPTSVQIQSVKEWLLYAVTKAEKELGSGTGKLKLSMSTICSSSGLITWRTSSLLIW